MSTSYVRPAVVAQRSFWTFFIFFAFIDDLVMVLLLHARISCWLTAFEFFVVLALLGDKATVFPCLLALGHSAQVPIDILMI